MPEAQRYKGWNVMHTVPYEVLNVANSTSTRQASGRPSPGPSRRASLYEGLRHAAFLDRGRGARQKHGLEQAPYAFRIP